MRLLLLAMCFMAVSCVTYAQEYTFTGVITSASTNEPIYGARISEVGTENNYLSNTQGKFTIRSEKDSLQLTITARGFEPKTLTVGNATSIISIPLVSIFQEVEDVVVTALSQKRSTTDLGYTVQTLEGDEVSEVKSLNVLDNLAGQIAGVQVTQGATGVGSTSTISIRGEASFTNNNPLFVIDGIIINNNSVVNPTNDAAAGFQSVDFGNGAMDVNPDDIESVTVLKGPSAAALYGTRASNGVIVITTKQGKRQKGLGITFNSTTYIDDAFTLPEFQNSYGQGNNGQFAFQDGLGGGVNDGISYSWGPELNAGVMTTQFDSPVLMPDGTYVRGGDVAVHGGAPITPTEMVSYEDNLKDFYQTGVTSIQNIAISNAFDKGSVRFSVTDTRAKGIIPGVNFDRTNALANMSFQPTEKLSITSSLQYARSSSDNRPSSGYGSENLNYSLVAWGPRSLDISAMEDYWQPGLEGRQQYSFNYLYFDNPYFTLYENRNSFARDRMIGGVNAEYKFNAHWNVRVRTGIDFSQEGREFRRAYSSNRFQQGAYAEQAVGFREQNTDILATYSNKWDNFGLEISGGANRMDQSSNNSFVIANALAQPGTYTLSNSSVPLETAEYSTQKRINSVYGIARLRYKSYLFLDVTGRNDWSSALATPTSSANASFFYPSASLSYVLSRTVNLPEAFSFVKLRASVAQVGNDTDPYQTVGVYIPQVAYNNQPTVSAQSTIPNSNLLPERTTSYEFGTDIRLFDNRLRFDVTYYDAYTVNQILSLPVAISSGYTQQVVNGGKVRTRGLEMFAQINAVQKEHFSWNTGLNFSRNVATVEELPEGATTITLAYNRIYDNVNQTVWYQVEEGGRIGDMYGTGYAKTEDGRFIVDANGNFVVDNEVKKLGNYNPDFVLSWKNDLSYKNFDFSFLFDWQQGGSLISRTLALAGVGGQLIETENRPEEGIVVDGVVNVGTEENPVYEENTTAISAESYYRQYYDRNHEENNMYNASFLKLRQFSIGYTFRNEAKEKGFVAAHRTFRVAVIGRNLFAISSIPHFDPEQLATQGNQFTRGVENMSYASTRSIGIKLGYNF